MCFSLIVGCTVILNFFVVQFTLADDNVYNHIEFSGVSPRNNISSVHNKLVWAKELVKANPNVENDIRNVVKNIRRQRKDDTNSSGKIDRKQTTIHCGARSNVTCPSHLECTGYFGEDIILSTHVVQSGVCTPRRGL